GMDYDSSNNYFTRNIADVKFVDAANSDFRLLDISPAVNKGKDVTGLGISFDALGVSRTDQSAFDIGAMQHLSAGFIMANSSLDVVTESNTASFITFPNPVQDRVALKVME